MLESNKVWYFEILHWTIKLVNIISMEIDSYLDNCDRLKLE